MCGFIHSTFVTVPVNLIGLFLSYSAAKEWCASTGVTEQTKPKQAVTKPSMLRRIARPPWMDTFVDCRIIEFAVCRVKPLDSIQGGQRTPVQFACQKARHIEVFGRHSQRPRRVQD
jgi:hypothetical protein